MLQSPADGPPTQARGHTLREVLATYGLATAAAAALFRVRALDEYFHLLVAALFLYLPAWVLRRHDLARFGLTSRPLGANLALLALTTLVVFPPFLLGFVAWQRLACAVPLLHGLAPTACPLAGAPAHLALRLSPALLSPDPRRNLLLAEVLVVALPEEFFFRGYLMSRLEQVWPPRRRLWGAGVGLSLWASAALFALSHLAVQGSPTTLAVFFPGLVFGWLRARSGSILPGTLFHALCNVYIDTLARSLPG